MTVCRSDSQYVTEQHHSINWDEEPPASRKHLAHKDPPSCGVQGAQEVKHDYSSHYQAIRGMAESDCSQY
jgi:hypothetical protein